MLTTKQRIILSALVIVSASLCLLAAAMGSGYDHPIRDHDSQGHPFGFNNPMSWEMYGILLASASWSGMANQLGWLGGIYLLFHFLALYFFKVNLLSKRPRTTAISFFIISLLFPIGWVSLWFAPFTFYWIVTGKIDGETLTDGPPFWVLFQFIWIITCFVTGFLVWRRRGHHDAVLPDAARVIRPEETTGN